MTPENILRIVESIKDNNIDPDQIMKVNASDAFIKRKFKLLGTVLTSKNSKYVKEILHIDKL
jgi:hypothetical protein